MLYNVSNITISIYKTDLTLRPHIPHWFPFALLVAGILATLILSFLVYSIAEIKDQLRFVNSAQKAQDTLDSNLNNYVTILRAGAGLFAASQDVTRDEFQAFANKLELRQHYLGMQGIGFALLVKPEEKEQVINTMQQQLQTNFNFRPDNLRSEYYPIIYLEPQDKRNKAAIGYDMFSDMVRRAAMERARDSGQPAASGKVTLVQEIDQNKQAGFLIYVPVYENNTILTTVDDRRRAIKGFVYSPFRADDLLNGIFNNNSTLEVDLSVYDENQVNDQNLLHKSSTRNSNSIFPFKSSLRIQTNMEIWGRQWTLVSTPNTHFVYSLEYYLIPLTLLGGWSLSFIAFALVRIQIKAREEAEKVADKLRLSQQALRQSEKLKDEFLSIASHELKTPVTSLKAYTQILHKRFLAQGDVETANNLGKMDGQLNKLNGLISDLLDVSKIEAGRLKFNERLLDIDDLVTEITEEMQRTTTKHSIVIEGTTKQSVVGDRERIGQVLINLLSNAIKYSPDSEKIIIKRELVKNNILISVQDFGVGIPKESQSKIFGRFYRVGGPKREIFSGFGLGLYISAEIVKRHGGKIWVESSDGFGSMFCFTLPLKKII